MLIPIYANKHDQRIASYGEYQYTLTASELEFQSIKGEYACTLIVNIRFAGEHLHSVRYVGESITPKDAYKTAMRIWRMDTARTRLDDKAYCRLYYYTRGL